MSSEQRNLYKGLSPRAWVRLRFRSLAGSAIDLELIVDTGSPFAVIVGSQHMQRLQRSDAPDVDTNFGLLRGGWIRVSMPEFGLDEYVSGYENDHVVSAAKADSADYDGLVGLPLLRKVQYGGDATWFWMRKM